MFEISELKAKKLPELQEIAKASGVPKFRSLKKLDLVYKILDHQAANPSAVKSITKETKVEAPAVKQKPQDNKEVKNSPQELKQERPKKVSRPRTQKDNRSKTQQDDRNQKSQAQKPNPPQQNKKEVDWVWI